MILSSTLINKLKLIKKDLYEVSEEKFTLKEFMEDKVKNEKDESIIDVLLSKSCICIKKIDKNTAQIFSHQRCADFLIFELVDSNNNFKLHILEFKRSVHNNSKSWPEHITDQFIGGYINGLAIAGYLNINIVDIAVYTCYRFDKVSPKTDPLALRIAASASAQKNIDNRTENIENWLNDTPIIIFDKDDEPKIAKHKKIPVDENFYACSSLI